MAEAMIQNAIIQFPIVEKQQNKITTLESCLLTNVGAHACVPINEESDVDAQMSPKPVQIRRALGSINERYFCEPLKRRTFTSDLRNVCLHVWLFADYRYSA